MVMKNAKESGANGDMPAFSAPNIIASGSHNTINAPSGTGLTKRELFAAMAMQAIIGKAPSMRRTRDPENGCVEGPTDDQFASRYRAVADGAVGYADALLAALDASRPVEPKPKATGGGE